MFQFQFQLIMVCFLLLGCVKQPTIQLVESVPLELSADNPDIPNASDLWKELFTDAVYSIDLASFYISPGEGVDALDPIWSVLQEGAQRGVRIRVLVDKKFAEKYPEPLEELRGWPNTTLKLSDYGDGVMHAKYFIIDGKEAFLGSQNFDYRALEHIFELGVHITDPEIVAGLTGIFEVDWYGGLASTKTFFKKDKKAKNDLRKNKKVVLVGSPLERLPQGIPHDLPLILSLIDGAQHTLRLQFLSYNNRTRSGENWVVLDQALIAAVKRGVRVELMVSDWANKGSKGASLQKLKAKGVQVTVASVPKHSSGDIPFARTIHAKYIVADGQRCWLGTSNASKGYFFTSRNVGLILKQEPECRRIDRLFIDIQKRLSNVP